MSGTIVNLIIQIIAGIIGGNAIFGCGREWRRLSGNFKSKLQNGS
jgi:hypothetical protein